VILLSWFISIMMMACVSIEPNTQVQPDTMAGHDMPGEGIVVSEAWARPALAEGNGAVYFHIMNHQAEDDTLVRASSDVADSVELHQSIMEGEVMKMTPRTEGVSVSAESMVMFEPGGLHVMLIDLEQDLKVGDMFELTLTFAQAEPLEVMVEVKEGGGGMGH